MKSSTTFSTYIEQANLLNLFPLFKSFSRNTNMKPKPVTHVVFDVDGLLLDTETLYTQATEHVLKEYGKEFTWDLKSRQMGMKENEGADLIVKELDLPISAEKYLELVKAELARLFPTVDEMPGAQRLVTHLHFHGVPIALATGSNTWSYGLKIMNHQTMFSMFHHAVLSGDDPQVKHGKPAPDIFLIAAERFYDKPPPDKVLVFEDSMLGVEAAHAAGMQVVWVPDPRADVKKLRDKATVILSSLEDFKPEEFGLPPYEPSAKLPGH